MGYLNSLNSSEESSTHFAEGHEYRVIRDVQFYAVVNVVRQLDVSLAAVQRGRRDSWYFRAVHGRLDSCANCVEQITTALEYLEGIMIMILNNL